MFKNVKRLISIVAVLALLMGMFSFLVTASGTNLAAGKAATASSFDSAGYEGSKAVDGVIDGSHEWYSYGNTNEWLNINLGSAQSFNQVKVYWGLGYAAGYKIQGSSNGTAFTDIPGAVVTNGTGGIATINFTAVTYRYVRLYTTTAPTGNYGHEIMELEVYGDDSGGTTGTNIAAGKSFTSSTSCTGASYVTDGDASTSNYYADLTGTDLQWIQFDLGEGAVTRSVNLWHYYVNGRTYHDVIVQLSDDPTFSAGITTVFNNDTNNSAGRGTGTNAEYAESSAGKVINVNDVTARYIRFYTNGSSSNAYNHYVEVQVFGTEGSSPTPTPSITPTPTPSAYVHEENHVYIDYSQDGLDDDNIKNKLNEIAKSKYKMKYLFIRIAGLDDSGNPSSGDVAAYGSVGNWIRLTRQYHSEFKIIGVINTFTSIPVNAGGTAHTNFVNFAKKACGVNGQGFAYEGVNYYCDGVHLNTEPTGDILTDKLNTLLASIRTGIGSSKILSLACAGDPVNVSITNNTYNGITEENYNWKFGQITTMAKYVDIFAPMAYDQCNNGVPNASAYRTYCKNLAIYYAEAVNAQTDRTRTDNTLLVQLSVPMYDDRGNYHFNAIETPLGCMKGIMDAINANSTAYTKCQSAGVFYGGYLFGYNTHANMPYSATQLQDWWENCWLKGNINY